MEHQQYGAKDVKPYVYVSSQVSFVFIKLQKLIFLHIYIYIYYGVFVEF